MTVLSPKDVGMIQIPVLPTETQRRLVQKVNEADAAYHEALQKAERLRREPYAEVLREMGIGEFVKV